MEDQCGASTRLVAFLGMRIGLGKILGVLRRLSVPSLDIPPHPVIVGNRLHAISACISLLSDIFQRTV